MARPNVSPVSPMRTGRPLQTTLNNNASTPYNIISVRQLRHWADTEPERLLDTLSQLQADKETLTNALTAEQHRNTALNNTFAALNAKYQLQKERRQAEREASQFSNISMQPVTAAPGERRSQKLPDPPLLDNGLEPTWDSWIQKIRAKLAVNGDHYPNETSRMGYVLSCLSGKAAQHTESRSPFGSSAVNPYCTMSEVLDDLKDVYEDPDKLRNYRRAYIELV